jgi:hypothetical protein
MSTTRLFLIILALYLLLAIGYSVIEPLGEAPDEADHYNYITYIGLNRSLPEGTAVTQSKHPPLYHAVAAGLTSWTGLDFAFLRSNPDALPLGPDKPPNLFVHTTLEAFPWRVGALAMHLARFFSIVLGAITIWGTWRLGTEAFPGRPAIGLLAAAFLAGLPGFLFISGSINNDNAAAAFGTLVILLCAMILSRGLAWGRAALLGVFLGLGVLSKVGTLALWPLVALAIGLAWWVAPNRRRALPAAAGQAGLAWGIGVLIASPWLIRNWRLYGDPLAWDLVRATVDQRVGPLALRDIGWLLAGFHRTFWGRFGGAGQIELPIWAHVAAAVATVIVIAGAIRFVATTLSHSRTLALPHARNSAIPQFLLLASAPLLLFLSVVRYSAIALGTDQVRLMFPALAAMAVWVGVGVVGLADWGKRGAASRERETENGDRGVVVGFAVGMALVGVAVLLGVIRPGFAPPQRLDTGAVPSGPPQATFGGSLELLAAELPTEPLAAGEAAQVRLIWRAGQPVASDLRPTLRLVHSDGWLAAEWSHSPAGGRYATDRWRPGDVIADDYVLVPQPASPGTYRVELAVRPFGGDWLPPDSPAVAGTSVLLGQIIYD